MTNVHFLHTQPTYEQLDLFGHQRAAFHKYCWLDVSRLNQLHLINCTNRFQATHVLDARSLPVFRRPKFNIETLLCNFETNDISYVSMFEQDVYESLEKTKNEVKMASVIRTKLNIILLYEASDASVYVSEYKQFFENVEDTKEAILNF